ncbi:uncharacterized protein LOC131647756 isoform X1 [Vicia villosa]|uniref:uncharacterized protein LOC131647756 isoform X1 n=1 Tax=Vicia villosa TaxID=3911 RepID=UPI00273BE2AA|nr:uncharacterized protein LOC131647756 isoform X1 [Vicia villosa]
MPLSSLHNRPSPSRSHRRPPFSLPSTVLVTVLFLELRKIEKLEEENVLEVNWLMELPREVMVCMFILVSQNREIYATTEEHVILQTNEAKQFWFPGNANPGDYFFGSGLEGLIQQLAENDPSRRETPPALKSLTS